jgi:predicted phage baseplate assembly protein
VNQLRRADGGRDQETLDEAKMRARREVRAQQRAVTADDYAVLAKGASRAVARVKCVTPARLSPTATTNLPPGMLELLVVPAVFDALRNDDVAKLSLDPVLSKQIEEHVDPYRLLTTSVRVREPRYIGVKVTAEVVASDYSDPEVVRTGVKHALRNYLAPLDLTEPGEDKDELMGSRWEGWPFGRSLFISELYTLIQRVPGVKHVLEVRMGVRPVLPKHEAQQPGDQLALVPIGQQAAIEEDDEAPLTAVKDRRLEVPGDALLVSLDHDVEIVKL